MVKIYKQPFAHDGDAIAIPDASQPDGKMSRADGWTPDYQLLKTDPNYKPVGRQEMNGVFKEVTEALGQVQVQGAASWSPDGAPYPINAQVYHSGKQWLALRANSVEPAEGADWRQAFVIPTGQNIVVFDTAGVVSWTAPDVLQSGLLKAHVTVVGGGGAGGDGGGTAGFVGGGGGAGGTSIGMVSLSGVVSVSVTVGAGGVGQNASGGPGSSSSFGSYMTATGGGGGGNGAVGGSGGDGGYGTGGDINLPGGMGADGRVDSIETGGLGCGGASYFGGGGRSGSGGGWAGRAAGSGGGSSSGLAYNSGANGAAGLVIIQW